MRLRALSAAAILALTLLSGCAAIVHEPQVTVKGASLTGIGLSGVDAEFLMGVTNPNLFDLSLLGYTYEVRVQDMPFSTGGLQETTLFAAGRETELRVPVHFTFADLLRIVKSAGDPDRIPCQLNAHLHLKTPLGTMTIPVEKSAVVAIPAQYRPAAHFDRFRDALRSFR
jgi:LEA14-like dessication related protein